MRKTILFLIITFLTVSGISAQKLQEGTVEMVKSLLKEMGETDQRYRGMITFGVKTQQEVDKILQLPEDERIEMMYKYKGREYGLTQAEHDSFWALQNELDSINQIRLFFILDNYGYPDEETFGKNNFDLILFHADAKMVLEREELLRKEVKAKKMDPETFAQVIDRHRLTLDMNQKYGAVYRIDDNGNQFPPDIVNVKAVNKARKDIGLDKITEYQLIGK